jgi:hypothetical protein
MQRNRISTKDISQLLEHKTHKADIKNRLNNATLSDAYKNRTEIEMYRKTYVASNSLVEQIRIEAYDWAMRGEGVGINCAHVLVLPLSLSAFTNFYSKTIKDLGLTEKEASSRYDLQLPALLLIPATACIVYGLSAALGRVTGYVLGGVHGLFSRCTSKDQKSFSRFPLMKLTDQQGAELVALEEDARQALYKYRSKPG